MKEMVIKMKRKGSMAVTKPLFRARLLRAVTLTVSLMLTVMVLAPAVSAESDGTGRNDIGVAAEADTMPPAFADMADDLPDDLAMLLPDGLFSEDPEEALAAAEEMSDWRYLMNALLDAVGLRLSDAVGLLCTLTGLLLIAAILGKMRDSLGGAGGEMFGFCLRLCLYAAIVTQAVGMVEGVQVFFEQLCGLTKGMMPVMGTLYALGGNLGQAAVTEELLLLFLALCQYISATVTPPVCAICLACSLMDALGNRSFPTATAIGAQVKRWYTWLLGFVMFLLSLALTAQSVLTGRADTLAMRGVKYAVGNMLPVVGGAVSGSLGTVMAGVELLRGVCGVAGVILVALLLLPTLVQLLLFRAMFRLATTMATLLGCDGEARLMEEIASLYGYIAAAVSVCSVMFIIALAIFIHSGTAMG